MARKTKVEKLGCEEIVLNGQREGKNLREIAADCTEWAGEKISHTSVARYLEKFKSSMQQEKREVIVQDRRRVLKVVNQELDIIQLQYDTTERLLGRFELVDDLPEFFKNKMDELVDKLVNMGEGFEVVSYLESWQSIFETELKRKIYEITTLNRELRENSKFLAELREKAFEFSLIQEYLFLFMEEFKKVSEESYNIAMQKVSSNPRMQRIVEQQQQMKE